MVAAGSHIAAGRVARLPGQVDLEYGMILVPSRHMQPLSVAHALERVTCEQIMGLFAGRSGAGGGVATGLHNSPNDDEVQHRACAHGMVSFPIACRLPQPLGSVSGKRAAVCYALSRSWMQNGTCQLHSDTWQSCRPNTPTSCYSSETTAFLHQPTHPVSLGASLD